MSGGTPWGAIVGGINETAGGIASSVLGRQASSQSWDRQKKVLKRQIQWRVMDLKKAGLNPILAAGAGVGGGGASAPMAKTPAGGTSSIASAVEQGRRTNAQIALDKATRDTVEESGFKTRSDRFLNEARIQTERELRAKAAAETRAVTANAKAAELAIPELTRRAKMWSDPATAPIMQMDSARGVAATLMQNRQPLMRTLEEVARDTFGAGRPTAERAGKAAGRFLRGTWDSYWEPKKKAKESKAARAKMMAPRPRPHASRSKGYNKPPRFKSPSNEWMKR